jgi:hypothetical protein
VIWWRESQQLRDPSSVGFYQIWFNNTPYNNIAELKSDQGWMIQEDDYFMFPGGGTGFPEGADGYLQNLEKHIPLGTSAIRTALDIGCGVLSFLISLSSYLPHELQ